MDTAIFGGTFNPPHRGHTLLVGAICRVLGLARCVVVPTFQPPHKAPAAGASPAQRLEMAALCDWGVPVEISDVELRRGGRSYTFDTLAEFHRRWPEDRLFFLMGSDMLLSFRQWHRYRELLGMATFCVAPRREDDRAALQGAADSLRAEGGTFLLVDAPPLEVSSTWLRARLAAGEDVSDYLDPAVLRYIEERRLYRGEDGK